MTYTQSDGLRDREFAKFTSENIGSQTGINVSNILKTYEFNTLAASTGAGSGLFTSHTSKEINGVLKAIVIKNNNFNATGSLYLTHSGLSIDVWSMQSGTATSSVDISAGFLPKAHARTNENISLSGTLTGGLWEDIPMYGHYILTGSGMGASKSGLGVILAYQ